jgi:hypothetical protein
MLCGSKCSGYPGERHKKTLWGLEVISIFLIWAKAPAVWFLRQLWEIAQQMFIECKAHKSGAMFGFEDFSYFICDFLFMVFTCRAIMVVWRQTLRYLLSHFLSPFCFPRGSLVHSCQSLAVRTLSWLERKSRCLIRAFLVGHLSHQGRRLFWN